MASVVPVAEGGSARGSGWPLAGATVRGRGRARGARSVPFLGRSVLVCLPRGCWWGSPWSLCGAGCIRRSRVCPAQVPLKSAVVAPPRSFLWLGVPDPRAPLVPLPPLCLLLWLYLCSHLHRCRHLCGLVYWTLAVGARRSALVLWGRAQTPRYESSCKRKSVSWATLRRPTALWWSKTWSLRAIGVSWRGQAPSSEPCSLRRGCGSRRNGEWCWKSCRCPFGRWYMSTSTLDRYVVTVMCARQPRGEARGACDRVPVCPCWPVGSDTSSILVIAWLPVLLAAHPCHTLVISLLRCPTHSFMGFINARLGRRTACCRP